MAKKAPQNPSKKQEPSKPTQSLTDQQPNHAPSSAQDLTDRRLENPNRMATSTPASVVSNVKSADGEDSVDTQKTKKEIEKLDAEIRQIKSARLAVWITPTALATIIGGFGLFVFEQYKLRDKGFQALSKLEKVQEERDSAERQRKSAIDDAIKINTDVIRLSALGEAKEKEIAKLVAGEERLKSESTRLQTQIAVL